MLIVYNYYNFICINLVVFNFFKKLDKRFGGGNYGYELIYVVFIVG